MKRSLATLCMLVAFIFLNATAIVVNSYNTNQLLRLTKCDYQVDIDNQVALVTLTETFKHMGTGNFSAKYNCPMPDGASPTQLRWFTDNQWWTALISPTPQDSNAVGPGGLPQYLKDYLGFFPLMFNLDMTMSPGDSVIVELSYVQLLPYADGDVSLLLKNNYVPVQGIALLEQSLDVTLHSDRTIISFGLQSHPGATINNDGHDATLHYTLNNSVANADYNSSYGLSSEELGLWAMSTYLDTVPDTEGRGFFTLIVEPDPSTGSEVIDKYFTLVIDVSGSMGWDDKITQARNAASYIVNNLNDGDYFNIIAFSTDISSLWPTHQPFNLTNSSTALSFIANLEALSATNISGALTVAIPQFVSAPANTANIIILLTDGVPTAGITDTQLILNHVSTLVTQYDVDITLFNFGIGSDVNQQLLTLLATNNNGIAQFLGNDELETAITAFYNLIRYPVIINPVFSVTPADAFTEVYPSPLPNLYLGRQMIISGRYVSPQAATVNFSGEAYNQAVEYHYQVALCDSANLGYQFLTRIWAKQKVEHLLVEYYSFPENSAQAILIRDQIIQLSIDYGIITPFTSFSGGTDADDNTDNNTPGVASIVLLGNFPNPFNPLTTIRFAVKDDSRGLAVVKIYNAKGQLVRIMAVRMDGKGDYEVVWNGKDDKGHTMPSGMYFYTLSTGKHVLSGKMTLVK